MVSLTSGHSKESQNACCSQVHVARKCMLLASAQLRQDHRTRILRFHVLRSEFCGFTFDYVVLRASRCFNLFVLARVCLRCCSHLRNRFCIRAFVFGEFSRVRVCILCGMFFIHRVAAHCQRARFQDFDLISSVLV